jgi:hypothetical protein
MPFLSVNVTTPYISLIVSRTGNLTYNTELRADLPSRPDAKKCALVKSSLVEITERLRKKDKIILTLSTCILLKSPCSVIFLINSPTHSDSYNRIMEGTVHRIALNTQKVSLLHASRCSRCRIIVAVQTIINRWQLSRQLYASVLEVGVDGTETSSVRSLGSPMTWRHSGPSSATQPFPPELLWLYEKLLPCNYDNLIKANIKHIDPYTLCVKLLELKRVISASLINQWTTKRAELSSS